VVDDEADALRLVGKVLADAGASITTAGSVRGAMAAVEKEPPHVMISDLGMPDEDGNVKTCMPEIKPAACTHLPGRMPCSPA